MRCYWRSFWCDSCFGDRGEAGALAVFALFGDHLIVALGLTTRVEHLDADLTVLSLDAPFAWTGHTHGSSLDGGDVLLQLR